MLIDESDSIYSDSGDEHYGLAVYPAGASSSQIALDLGIEPTTLAEIRDVLAG